MGPNDGPQFPETFTAHRVEGIPNQRINVDVDGNISLVPDNTNRVWVNFGQTDRATSYLARKIDAGLPGAELKSFEVDGNFVLKLRQNAIPERLARQYPDLPIISRDPFPDQFALPKNYFDEFLNSINQGTGRRGP